jgi:hypothetical protein
MEKITGTLKLTRAQLVDRVKESLSESPEKLYASGIVNYDKRNTTRNEGYFTVDTKERFTEVIAEQLVDSEFNVASDEQAKYYGGERKKQISDLREQISARDAWNYINEPRKNSKTAEKKASENKIYKGIIEAEPRMGQWLCAQKDVGDFEAIDFQVPTTNGKKDNIDLILKEKTSGDIYIVEFKKFKSSESLLRCVLEIETYFRKLNHGFSLK